MHDSIQLPEIAPFRAISPVPRRNQRHSLIVVLQVAAPILAGRITFPLLLLTSGLLLVRPCAGQTRAQDTYVAQATSEWGTATLIETNTSSADGSKLGMDADGNAIAVWSQGDGTYVSVWANRYVAGVGWGAATLIESKRGDVKKPQVATDARGNATAVWVQTDETKFNMWANRYVAGVGWGRASLIETNPGDAEMPRVAVDGKGNAMALWKQSNGVNYDIWANRYDVGSGWGTATLIESNPENASETWVAMDNSGNAMALWRQSDGVDLSIWANRYDVGSGWGTPTLIEPNPGFASFPHVEFDESGNAIVVWYQDFPSASRPSASRRSIWANRYVVGSGWGTPTLISTDSSNAQGASLAMDRIGNATATWRQGSDGDTSIWANRYDVGSGWGTATLVETAPGDAVWPDVAMDRSGNAMTVWSQFDGTYTSIWANLYVVGSGWGTATLIETEPDNADLPKVEMDGRGNAVAVWAQAGSIWANRFSTVQIQILKEVNAKKW